MRSSVIVILFSCLLSCSEVEKLEESPKWGGQEYQDFVQDKDSSFLNQPFKKLLTADEASNDFLAFRYILENAQTSIYRYSTKAKIDAVFNAEYDNLKDGTSYLGLLKSIARVQNEIACGHSGWSHHRDFYNFRNDSLPLIPLDIKVLNEKVIIKHTNCNNLKVDDNTELLSINGQPIHDVISNLKLHMVKDGNSAPNSNVGIESSFSNAYSNFVENSEYYSIELKTENETIKKIKLNGLHKSRIDSIRNSKYGKKEGLGIPLRFQLIDSISTAVYTIKWFRNDYMFFYGQDFSTYTDSVFKELEENQIKHLIVDLRGNVGGWTANGRELFSYFIKDTLPYIKRVESKLIDYQQFKPLLVSDPDYPDTAILEKNNNNLFEWKNYPSLLAFPEPENQFYGKVYILIDDLSRSCSSVFSSLMKEHTQAVFIGEENAATVCGSNAMVMSFKLPNSGISIYTSTAKYTAAISDTTNSRGIIPDVELEHSEIPKALGLVLNKIAKENIE